LVGVSFHAFTSEAVPTARSQIEINLPSDIFVERQEALIIRL
jgi:hypothetical protein